MKALMFAAAALALVLAQGAAGDIILSDDNSVVTFDVSSDSGMKSWKADGIEHLTREWFWYRVGPSGGESSVDTLTLAMSVTSDTNGSGTNDTLFVRYLGSGFKLEMTFSLRGGTVGSRWSDIAEQIKIVNTSPTSPLDFHFFEYCNFDLAGTVTDRSATIKGGNTAIQEDVLTVISETVETPAASHYDVATYSSTLDSLQDGNPTTLTDAAGPVGPGDLTWAFEWDFSLAPSRTFLISKDKLIVPEPATIVLLAAGAIGILARKRRRA